MKDRFQKIFLLAIGIFVLLNVYIWYEYFKPNDRKLYFYMLDVGQGDSLFVRTPDNQDILIDGGYGKKVLSELGRVMPFYDRYIDLIVLTHPHQDHIGGLIDVLERYEVGQILISGVEYDSSEYEEFLELAEEKEIKIVVVSAGDKVNLSDDLTLNILAPVNIEGKTIKNLNNSSIVSILDFKDFEILLSGDAELEEWTEILKNNNFPDIEILKTAHHGSSNGTSKALIEKLRPEEAFISLGEENKYGHPHKEALDLFDEYNINIYRTDELGMIKIVSDGVDYEIK